MADGYLERKMEDYLAGKLKPKSKKVKKTITPKQSNNNSDHKQ